MMTSKEFAIYKDRDFGRCYHCGKEAQVPQHRIGRGMGGSKSARRNAPANIISFCALANGELESSAAFAQEGAAKGWKLASWQEPEDEPVYEAWSGVWWQLDNDYGRRAIAHKPIK